MENKSHALAAGAFVLLCSALLLGLAWWLTRDAGIRVRLDVITTDAVTGVQAQSPVRYKGVDVGTVRTVRLDRDVRGQIVIEMQIDPATPLTQGSTATLAFQGVTGLAFVQIDDRGTNPALLDFSGAQPPRLTLQPNWISQLGEQGSGLVQGARNATDRVNELLAPANQQALNAAVQDIAAAAKATRVLTDRLKVIADAQMGPENINLPRLAREAEAGFVSVQQLSREAIALTQSVNAAVSGPLNASLAELQRAGQRLNAPDGALQQISAGSAALARSAQTLDAQTLPRLNTLADQVGHATQELGRASADISRTSADVGRVVQQLADQPASLVWGPPRQALGPGESPARGVR